MPPEAITAANKDCAKCRTRRIQCDRTSPECRKCLSRGFTCPGYGIVLRWDQGVASRGKLAGRSIPVKSLKNGPERSIHPAFPFQNPGDPFTCLSRHLICYFDQTVARRLAWVDGPANPWRNIVLPLSHLSPAVLSSVLAMASEDLARKYSPDHDYFRILQYATLHHRGRALSSLSQALISLRESPNSATAATDARCLLASVLLLYNLELLTAEASQWRLHIQGARAIIQQATHFISSLDTADIFLLYEYYYTSVFIGLTTFDPTDDIPGHIPTNANDTITIFSDFIRIMHLVTIAERSRFTHGPTTATTTPLPIQLDHIMHELHTAKLRTLHLSPTIQFESPDAQCDFEHLTWMYYHAGVIYSYRALSDSTCTIAQGTVLSSREAIFEHLFQITRVSSFAHNFAWPLFVVGTECRGLPDKQAIIERVMLEVIQISGSLDRHRVLWFLRELWGLDASQDVSWMELARRRAGNFGFLII